MKRKSNNNQRKRGVFVVVVSGAVLREAYIEKRFKGETFRAWSKSKTGGGGRGDLFRPTTGRLPNVHNLLCNSEA